MANHGLLHIALLTRDLKKTEQFYTQVLGLKVAFRVPPNMVFFRSPGSQDLINFVGTKKRLSANDALQHFGFKTTKAQLTTLEKNSRKTRLRSKEDAANTLSISPIPTATPSSITATRAIKQGPMGGKENKNRCGASNNSCKQANCP